MSEGSGVRLDRNIEPETDHVLGPEEARITLVEYGSYGCDPCRAARDHVEAVRERMGGRMRYAFRHCPIDRNLALRAAELVECAETHEAFWNAHVKLMTHSPELREEDLEAVARDLGLHTLDEEERERRMEAARQRVARDIDSARESSVPYTPVFYINSRRYDGPWDKSSLERAILGSLGYRVRSAALQFAGWAPAAGVALCLATVLALIVSNSPFAATFEEFWHIPLSLGVDGSALSLSLRDWVNEGLLSIFFFVVGLEIKREFTTGSLASRRSATLPVAAAIGGMAIPALLYLLIVPTGGWSRGWGVPMATDTAFAVALIAMMGRRVPVELRVFLTAAAIVDDIGAITVVAFYYSGELNYMALAVALATIVALSMLLRFGIYRVAPYALLGVVLWLFLHEAGLHATLAGVLLAAFMPTLPPPDYRALVAQADIILSSEANRGGHGGPSEFAMRALDEIHDRLESPADRVLRHIAPQSTFIVLPIFALANAGVELGTATFAGREFLGLAIAAGLVIGKPLGFVLLAALAVWAGLAAKPRAYQWRQLVGAGSLAGIGFTMSLFMAEQAFPLADDFAAAKIATFSASILSALIGVWILRRAAPADSRS